MTTTNTCSCLYKTCRDPCKTCSCKKCAKKKRLMTLLECQPVQQGIGDGVPVIDGFAAFLGADEQIYTAGTAVDTQVVLRYPSTGSPYFIAPGSSYDSSTYVFTTKFKGYYLINTNNQFRIRYNDAQPNTSVTIRLSIQRNDVNIDGTIAHLTGNNGNNGTIDVTLTYNHSIVLLLDANDQIRVSAANTANIPNSVTVTLLGDRCNFSTYLLQKV